MNDDLEAIVTQHILGAPLAASLGLRLEQFERDRLSVRLPFAPAVTTLGDLVHGGAISALIDVAATAAAWSAADLARGPRGTTVTLTVNFISGARSEDVIATAQVIQRGKSLVVCDVTVVGKDERLVARALVTYKLDHARAA